MQKIGFNNRLGLQDAVLERRKPLTRRIIPELAGKTNVRLSEFGIDDSGKVYITELNSGIDIYPKYQVGEVVAVAQCYRDIYGLLPDDLGPLRVSNGYLFESPGWTNKMFVMARLMPHQIRITNIRYERLQDISDEDCLREGVMAESIFDDNDYCTVPGIQSRFTSPRGAFAALIDKVSGKGTWGSNPWVWVYEFELVK